MKNKLKLIRQNQNRTGAAPIDLKLTEYENKIISICNIQLLDGNQELDEIGLGSKSIEGENKKKTTINR